MSFNVNFDTVANSISGLTFTGIHNLDLDKIPVNASMVCPVFFPRPDSYITDLTVTRQSFGTGTNKKIDLDYNLHYMYCHAAIGAKLDFGFYNSVINNIATILSKLFESDVISGSVLCDVNTISDLGPVNDPAGNAYHGCEIVLSIKQFGEN